MQVISAWDVYWVLQLDSIGFALGLLALLSGLVLGFTLLYAGIERSVAYSKDDLSKVAAAVGFSKKVGAVFAITFMIGSFIPSTKTAAAMIILPAIANNETIQKEASELYQLAKDALKEAVAGDEKSSK